jgi:Immunoglobulin I-set domain
VAPKIERRNLINITLREGEPLLFDAKITGEPCPTVTWTINDKSIVITSHRRTENVPYRTKFINDNTERKDTGLYKVSAMNKYGTDTVEIQVDVICKYSSFRLYFLFKLDFFFFFVMYSQTRSSRRPIGSC